MNGYKVFLPSYPIPSPLIGVFEDWIDSVLGGKTIRSNLFGFVICSSNWFGFRITSNPKKKSVWIELIFDFIVISFFQFIFLRKHIIL